MWPLEVGRAAFESVFPESGSSLTTATVQVAAIEAIRAGLPLEGRERALFAATFSLDGHVVGFFGLVDNDRLPELYGGRAIAIARGHRLSELDSASLALAEGWWRRTLLGKPIGENHRPKGSGLYRSGADLRADLDAIVARLKANGERPSQPRVLQFFTKTHRTRQLRRWVRDLLHMTWDEYIESVPTAP
jgi:hypothetical protein